MLDPTLLDCVVQGSLRHEAFVTTIQGNVVLDNKGPSFQDFCTISVKITLDFLKRGLKGFT